MGITFSIILNITWGTIGRSGFNHPSTVRQGAGAGFPPVTSDHGFFPDPVSPQDDDFLGSRFGICRQRIFDCRDPYFLCIAISVGILDDLPIDSAAGCRLIVVAASLAATASSARFIRYDLWSA
ncbi:hypothetical protein JH26_27970 [Microvirga sp. BSC39]|nr:hypothetical protein JH26_27970 [Microvirga sp. BSC39]